jgi:repressor LexA
MRLETVKKPEVTMELKDKTRKVLDKITGWFSDHNRPPTLRELAKETGFSSTWPLRYHLNKLVAAGYINMRKSLSRGMELTRPLLGIPLVGRISAGRPIDAIENIDEHIDSIAQMFGLRDTFALRVRGDSMEGEGIFDNDTVIVRKQRTATDGDVVAALLENDATVKKFYMTPDGIKLEPANPKYEPIISKDIRVLGKVIGVLRKLK